MTMQSISSADFPDVCIVCECKHMYLNKFAHVTVDWFPKTSTYATFSVALLANKYSMV